MGFLDFFSGLKTVIGTVQDAFNLGSGVSNQLYNRQLSERQQNLSEQSFQLSKDSYEHGIEKTAEQYRNIGINPASAMSGNASYTTSFQGGSSNQNTVGADSGVGISTLASLANAKLNAETSKQVADTNAKSAETVAKIEAESSERIAELNRNSTESIADADRSSSESIAESDRISRERIAELDRNIDELKESHDYEIAKRTCDNNEKLTASQIEKISSEIGLNDWEVRQIQENIKNISADTSGKNIANEVSKLSRDQYKATCKILNAFGYTESTLNYFINGGKLNNISAFNILTLWDIGKTYLKSGSTSKDMIDSVKQKPGNGSW